jgi:hypothetical protein
MKKGVINSYFSLSSNQNEKEWPCALENKEQTQS